MMHWLLALALAVPSQAALIHVPGAGAPLTRPAFQAMVAGQLAEYRALPPAMALRRLETLSALPSAQLPALAAERAAATAALALIVSPNASALTQDRETRIVMARALGKENVAAIAAAAEELKTFSAYDPALSASVARLRERFAPPAGSQRTDIGDVAGRLKEFFDQGKTPGYKSVSLGDAVDGRAILIPDRPSGLVKAPRQQGSGLLTQATPEGSGFVTSETLEDGRLVRRKVYPQDGVTVERRAIPSIDAGIYEELSGGAVKQKETDPLVDRLSEAKVDLWAVAPGPAEAARAAALKLYSEMGGDAWARAVAAGVSPKAVLLVGPAQESRRTASAFAALLDMKARSLKGAALYEARREKALREMDLGALGRMAPEKRAQLGAWQAFESGRSFLDRLPGGESRMDVLVRQQGLLRRTAKDFAGRKVVTFASAEAAAAQQAVFGLMGVDRADGALLAKSVPEAEPLRLSFAGAPILKAKPKRQLDAPQRAKHTTYNMALFEPVFAALNAVKVRYVVVGGLAVVLRGHPRLTADVDIVVDLEAEAAGRAIDALVKLGLKARVPEDPRSFADPEKRKSWHEDRNMEVFSLYSPENPMLSVDLFVHEPLPFDRLYGNSEVMELETTAARVASIDDLIAMKKAVGRPQDVTDVEALEAIKAKRAR